VTDLSLIADELNTGFNEADALQILHDFGPLQSCPSEMQMDRSA